MTKKIMIIWFALFTAIATLCVAPGSLCGQTSAIGATATIDFGNNQSVTATSNGAISDRVGLQPNQVVDVTVQFSADKAGRTIIVEPLDGGRVIGAAKKLIVATDGTFSFRFQAGHDPGVCQISLHDGAHEMGLQFWVLNQQNPQENPSVINSGN
jgi:hypothetical protein